MVSYDLGNNEFRGINIRFFSDGNNNNVFSY